MRFASLHVLGFGKFVNFNLSLEKELNLFLGANEAGKSTLINAFFGVLFGFRGREKERRALKEKYRPWQKGVPYAAGLTLVAAAGEKYYLERNFDEDKVKVYLWRDGGMLPSTISTEKLLEPVLGGMAAPVFTGTFLIRQEDISSLDRQEIGAALSRKLVAGAGDVNINGACKILEDRLREIYRGMDRPAANPGAMRLLRESIASMGGELAELEQHYHDFLALARKEKEVRASLEETREKWTRNNSLLTIMEKALALGAVLQEKSARQMELFSFIEQVREKKAELGSLRLQLEQIDADGETFSEEKGRRLESLGTSHKFLLAAVEEKKQKEAVIRECALELAGRGRAIRVWVLPVLGVLFLAGAAGVLLSSVYWGPAAALALGAVGSFATWWKLTRKVSGAVSKDSLPFQAALDQKAIGAEIEALEEEISRLEEESRGILTVAGVDNQDAYYNRLAEWRQLKETFSSLEKEITFMLGAESLEGRHSQLKELSLEIVNLKEQLEVLDINPAAEEYRLLKMENEELGARIGRLESEHLSLNANMDNYTRLVFQGRDRWVLEVSLEEKVRELEQLEIKAEGVKKALAIIGEAAAEAQSTLSPHVLGKASRIFRKVTGGRYRGIELSLEGGELQCMVISPETGEVVDPAGLSTGTRDQLYMALRVALGEFLAGSTHFPLLLDDPFVNFDCERLEQMTEILKEVARDHQVIWFTKDLPAAEPNANSVLI